MQRLNERNGIKLTDLDELYVSKYLIVWMHKISQKGFQLSLYFYERSGNVQLILLHYESHPALTFSAREEREESAGVAPAEPVPGLDEALVLWLGQQAGDEVGAQVGEAGGRHVPGDDHVGPVTLAQRERGVHRL